MFLFVNAFLCTHAPEIVSHTTLVHIEGVRVEV